MRILSLSKNFRNLKAFGHELFRDEIARQHNVVRSFGDGHAFLDHDVPTLIERHGGEASFDLIYISHLQFALHFSGFSSVSTPKALYVVDYFPRHLDLKNSWLRQLNPDFVLLTQRNFVERFKVCQAAGDLPPHMIPIWVPFSVDTDQFTTTLAGNKLLDNKRTFDATICFSDHAFEYPNRKATVQAVGELCGEYQVVAQLVRSPVDQIKGRRYCRLLADSSIFVGSTDQHGSTNMKIFEAMASGCLVLTDGPPHDFGALGFVEGEHYVLYHGPQDLKEKIKYYTDQPEMRDDIAYNGWDFVTGCHSNSVRVKEMFQSLTREIEKMKTKEIA